MSRIILEGFASTDEAKEFGLKLVALVKDWSIREGAATSFGDLMYEVTKTTVTPSVTPPLVGDTPEIRNFNYLKATLGEDAAYDYLVKHVPGGSNMVRDMFADRVTSAQIVQKYGVGASRGFIIKETNEYVLGGNRFTKQGGQRVKLPN